MKKSNIASIIIFATLICVALDSCQKKDDVQKTETEASVTSFYARSNGSGSPSRTSRQETGSVWWSPNDEITVFCGETSGKFVSQNEESADVATFIGSFDSPVSTSDVSSKGVVAFYPYSEDLSCSEGTVTFSLPASQPALAGTFDEELYPLIARSNSTELSFYNICGGAKFTVSQDGIKTVTFKGNASEPLAGKLSVTFDENGVPTVEVLEGETEIVVTAPDDGTFEVGKEYYIVTIPQSLAKGFTLIYNDGLSINNEFKTDKAITIRRSKFGVLKYLDEDLDMINLSDPIVFEDSAVEKICVDKWDTDGDGSLSYAEAAAVKTIGTLFRSNTSITSFDEFQYFTGVTSIAYNAFYNCTGLTSVTIPSSVTSIGIMAFYGCSSLTSVTIPEGVTSIGSSAFSRCRSLTSVTIPSSVTSIVSGAFLGCSSLTSVTIPSSVTSIGSSAFYGCSSLASVTIPSSVTSIGSEAFYYCRSLTSVTIPEGVTSIDSKAFSGCSSLASVTIPEGVTSIEYGAFSGCSSLTSVTIPEGVTSIGDYAFSGCSSLTSVTIPEGVTSIGSYAFSGCSSLTSVTIPSSVTSIGSSAFYGCSSLASVTIPSSVTSIGSEAFSGCSSLTSVTIPSSVTSIEGKAFYKCSSLTSVTIPEGVTSIENEAFYNCTSLTSVTIPEGVTSIEYGAFSGCSSLTSVTIPSSVTSIEDRAFYGCTGECVVNCNVTSSFLYGAKFTKVVIGEGVTIVNCSDLSNCSNLMSVTIPSSVTSFRGSFGSSFSGECEINCNFTDIFSSSGIKKVVIGEGVTSIEDMAFYDCRGLTSVTISEGVTSIGSSAFSCCRSLTSVTIPSSVTSIEGEAFYDCRGLTSVTISEGVTSIENEAFYNCTSLTSVTIPSSVTSIESDVFRHCTSLTSVTISEGVTSIGSEAFSGCSSLTSVTIPSSVTSIEDRAFYDCTSLTSVTIPEGVTSIEHMAFYNCSSLTSVTIPSSVTWIGTSAFSGCNNLKNVTFHSKCPPGLESSAFDHCSSLCFFLPVESESAYLTAYPWKTFAESMVFGLKLPSAKGTYTYAGGTIEFDYIKDESLDVQPLVAVSDAWWISSLCDTGNSVRCELAENTSEYSRTGIVTVSYAGVNKTFNITQQGCLVTELSLNTDSMTLFAGDKVELIASVYPVDAKLQWSSSDPSIASVDQNGKVTGLNKGVTDITVKSLNGNMSATCTVTILLHVSGVSLDKTFAKMPKGENLALTVTVSPSDAYDKNVTWSSSNPSVATVSDQGVVSARNVGKTTITVLTNDSGKKAECEVLVFIPIEDIILDKATVELIEGDSVSLVPTLLPTDAFYDLIWSSSDTNVAKVSSTGKVAAVKAGTAEIVVKSEYSGESATCIVTVVKRTASGGMEGTEDEDWGI